LFLYVTVLMNKLGAQKWLPEPIRETQMQAFFTLFRRTAAVLGAIAATTVIGPATAQTITLSGASGNTCTYSTMSVNPSGNFTVTCTSSTSPGTFALAAVTSLSTSSTSTSTQIRILRSGGTAGTVTVPFTTSGAACGTAQTVSPVEFAAGDTAQPIILQTASTPGTCRVSIQAPSDGSLGSPSFRDISIVDPDADVTFAFAASQPEAASVGGSNLQIVVTRTGGSNNAWSVPVNLSGSLTSGGNMISGGGAVTPTTLNFAAGSSQATITFDPPNTPPVPALPLTLTLSLGTPTTTATTTQSGSATGAHTITLNGPAAGCPVPETSATTVDAAFASGTTLLLPSGVIKTFVLPTPKTGFTSGVWWMSAGTSSFPVGLPYHFEVHINKCKGLVQETAGDLCYGKFSTKTGTWSRKWFTKLIPGNAYYDSISEIKAKGCWAPASEGPWYVNIRYLYPSCDPKIGAMCGWNYQWKNGTI
jgi:hypothetical protein